MEVVLALDRRTIKATTNLVLLISGIRAQFILSAPRCFSTEERVQAAKFLMPKEKM